MKRRSLDARRCLNCEFLFWRTRYPGGRLESPDEFLARKFCSHRCYSDHHTGENHSAFKPEGSVRKDGYVRVSRAGKRVYLHREVAAKALGRELATSEHVHHKDEDKGHNEPDNFEVCSNSGHRKLHAATQPRDATGRFRV